MNAFKWDNDLLANFLKALDGSGYDITLTGFDLAEAQELFGSGSMENVHEDDFDAETAIEDSEFLQGGGSKSKKGRTRLCVPCQTRIKRTVV